MLIALKACVAFACIVSLMFVGTARMVASLDPHPRRTGEAMPQIGGDFCMHNKGHFNESTCQMPSKLDPATDLIGCNVKFWLRMKDEPSNVKYIWKAYPWADQKKAFNEAAAYTVDQLLEFNRTPPAFLHPLPIEFVKSELADIIRDRSNKASKRYRPYWGGSCFVDHPSWYHDIIQSSPKAQKIIGTDESGNRYVFGVAQKYIDGLKELRFESEAINKIGDILPVRFSGRERGTRAMFDYLIGNQDRIGNEMSYKDMLVYIDNDFLSKADDAQVPLSSWKMLDMCKIYKKPYDNLKHHLNNGTLQEKLINKFKSFNNLQTCSQIKGQLTFGRDMKHVMNDKIPQPFHPRAITSRAKDIVVYMEKCLDQFGQKYVFYE